MTKASQLEKIGIEKSVDKNQCEIAEKPPEKTGVSEGEALEFLQGITGWSDETIQELKKKQH